MARSGTSTTSQRLPSATRCFASRLSSAVWVMPTLYARHNLREFGMPKPSSAD